MSVSFDSYPLQILAQFQSEIPFVSILTNVVVECHNRISHEGDSATWFAFKLDTDVIICLHYQHNHDQMEYFVEAKLLYICVMIFRYKVVLHIKRMQWIA